MAQRHVATCVGVGVSLTDLRRESAEQLWARHERARKAYRRGAWARRPGEASWLELKSLLGEQQMQDCHLCTWDCGVDRRNGINGRCGVGRQMNLTAEYLHMGEEPELVPAHTLFFTGCTMQCSFCQNWKGAFYPESGAAYPVAAMAEIVVQREAQGARCVNFVGGTPEPYLPMILELALALPAETQVPFVFNCNGTATPEALALMEGVIDLYLPDWKYGTDRCSEQHSAFPNYWQTLETFVTTAARQGDLLIRHLVMPGHLVC
ncbi:MAG: radical SAM protein, partial [Candidatus Sericytochromatia bacterium]|nr:radical SAM protein [Candidatus Sericytochromatia bacterium]